MDYSFFTRCAEKVIADFRGITTNVSCHSAPSTSAVAANPNCSTCLPNNNANLFKDADCVQCWLALGYAWGRCGALQGSGLTFYASEAVHLEGKVGWNGNNLTELTCGPDYFKLVGIANTNNSLTKTVQTPSTVSTTFNSLPAHYGLYFAINIFKIDYWALPANFNATTSPNKL